MCVWSLPVAEEKGTSIKTHLIQRPEDTNHNPPNHYAILCHLTGCFMMLEKGAHFSLPSNAQSVSRPNTSKNDVSQMNETTYLYLGCQTHSVEFRGDAVANIPHQFLISCTQNTNLLGQRPEDVRSPAHRFSRTAMLA